MPRVLPLLLAAAAAFAEPVIRHVDVFRAGDDGYFAYRIPAIVTAADGSLVAFAEARKENRSDPGGGDIDLVAKRSTDNGATWSKLQVVDDPGEKWGASNPTPVLDRTDGRLWLLYNRWEPGFGTEKSKPGTSNNQTWARFSTDHGKTWSAPRDLTRATRDYDHWGAIFLGPGGAIQTKSGRLLIPAAMKFDAYTLLGWNGSTHGVVAAMRAYAFYSDDHGETWKRGAVSVTMTNENQLVELADGSIFMDARQDQGPRRWNLISNNGGETWASAQPGLEVSAVATSIERFSSKAAGADRNRLIWTGPTGPGRKHLVVRVSYDEGQTWINERVLYGGPAAYSDATMLRDGTAGILWERGTTGSTQFVTLTTFNREFLEPPGTVIPVVK